MEPLSPQVMHKLVFTIMVHGLPDAQTGIALDVLVEALRSPNGQVRELAVVALAELGVSPSKRVAALASVLRDPYARVRRRAARALGDFGAYALQYVSLLTTGLKDPDSSVRRDCAGTIGRLGPAAHSASAALVGMLAELEIRSRVVAATALKRIGRPALGAVVQGLANIDPDVRARCVTLLGQMAPDDEQVAEALRIAAADADEEVRRRVSEALIQTPVPTVTPSPLGVLVAV